MRHPCRVRLFSGWIVLLVLTASACVVQHRTTSNVLDFLYPQGAAAVSAGDVTLQLPVRVGVAFAPPSESWRDTFSEIQKKTLLERVAEAFRDREILGSVQVVPSSMLKSQGGFENLHQLAAAFGLDVMVLVSYDQFQLSESGKASWTYWTVVGAYLVKGERNETRTVLEAIVYDIPSRAMLFNASGQSEISGRSTPIDMSRAMRKRGEQGFDEAMDTLIAELESALAVFETQAMTGTIRGQGTPAIQIVDVSGEPVKSGGGGGALSWPETVLIVIVSAVALVGEMRRRHRRHCDHTRT
jgi:rhombotail lipoprotein